ncbi:unnamed protein product [marine sediment metagenome]|uniref:Uncharacterized protein n=1 Tax=marine sediment metagenome TaxID=412755 RepID=X1G3Q4_9ZZZZ
MEKISAESKKRYAERIKVYKASLEEILSKCKKLEAEIRIADSSKPSSGAGEGQPVEEGAAAPSSSQDSMPVQDAIQGPNYKRLLLAAENLNLVSYYILMNSLSLSLLGIKNEAHLNEARKCCYKSIICLEEIVTRWLDVPFSDYEKGLVSIDAFNDREKYNLVRKMGFSIDAVVEGFGESSKWKWSFVELEGRYTVVTKNLINLKTFTANLDPRIEGYSERLAHLNLTKRLFQQSSDRYREKYELSTHRSDDIKRAISFLSALRRLHILLGESDQAEDIKKKIDIWRVKMEADQKKREQERRMEKLKKKS